LLVKVGEDFVTYQSRRESMGGRERERERERERPLFGKFGPEKLTYAPSLHLPALAFSNTTEKNLPG